MARVNKVAHVVLSVKDVMTSVDFYTKALGLEVVDLKESHRAAFLSFGKQHHDIALFAAPEGAERGKVGLSHIAFQIEGGLPELAELKGRLEEMGASISRTTDHTITKSVYFPTPTATSWRSSRRGLRTPTTRWTSSSRGRTGRRRWSWRGRRRGRRGGFGDGCVPPYGFYNGAA